MSLIIILIIIIILVFLFLNNKEKFMVITKYPFYALTPYVWNNPTRDYYSYPRLYDYLYPYYRRIYPYYYPYFL